MDNDCGNMVSPNNTMSALQQGLITEALIDERVGNLFRVRFRLGQFDAPGPLDEIQNSSTVCTPYALELAREGVAQGTTLVKNVAKRLPLDAKSVARVAVIGPMLGDGTTSALSKYYGPLVSCNNFPYTSGHHHTMVDAVKHYVSSGVEAHCGISDGALNSTTGKLDCASPTSSYNATSVASAAELASTADAVILVVGDGVGLASEGHDATNISMPEAQARLIEQVAAAAKQPVIVVVITASALSISAILDNPQVGAVLHAGEPGDNSLGIADVIFGARVPAGRMIQTVYDEEWQNSISILDMNMRPGPSDFPRPDCHSTQKSPPCPNATNPGRTHRFYTGKPTVAFGFGLSFTTFSYKVSRVAEGVPRGAQVVEDQQKRQQHAQVLALGWVAALLSPFSAQPFPPQRIIDQAGAAIQHKITVTNTGTIAGDDVVLGFVIPPGAGQNGVPLQSLYGFERVHVEAGQSVSVILNASALEFTQVFTDADGREGQSGVKRVVVAGGYTFQFGVSETRELGQGFATDEVMTAL